MEAHAGDDKRRWRKARRNFAKCAGAVHSTRARCTSASAKSTGAAQLNKIFRGLIILIALALISAVCFMCLVSAQEPPKSPAATFQISGSVRNGKTFLPGVAVTVANTLTGKKYSVVSATNGAFQFIGLPRGRYVVRVEFMGFATVTQEVVLNPENPAGKVEAELVLASRQREQQAEAAQTARHGFQNLAMSNSLSALAGEAGAGVIGGNASGRWGESARQWAGRCRRARWWFGRGRRRRWLWRWRADHDWPFGSQLQR